LKKGLKKDCSGGSIKGMNCFVFNAELGRYEQVKGFLTGNSSVEMAAKYGVSHERTRQYALEHNLPYLGTFDKVHIYIYDEAAETAFANRRKESPGRPAVPKPPKVPGKPGRPRKEKPVDTAPKQPVGRPRKYPKEALDIVPKRQGRGRPRKR
jgi:hypothetical protein